MKYRVVLEGDLPSSVDGPFEGDEYFGWRDFKDLESALLWVGRDVQPNFDCEDDRVTIHEILDSGHSKVIWHCSGWHWPFEYGDYSDKLEQGILPGDHIPMYTKLMKEY